MQSKDEAPRVVSLSTIKVDAAVKTYDGSGSITDWLTKFRIVRGFSDWTDDDAVRVLVLRLEGRALLVYMNMPEADKFDLNKVMNKLQLTFGESPQEALKSLVERQWMRGDSAEALYAELAQKVAVVSGAGAALDEFTSYSLVRPYFMRIVPSLIRSQLMLSKPSSATELVENARLLLAELGEVDALQGTVGGVRDRPANNRRSKSARKPGQKPRRCVRCGSLDHLSPECSFPYPVCWNCQGEGHMSAECPRKDQRQDGKNGKNVTGAVCGAVAGRSDAAVCGAAGTPSRSYPLVTATVSNGAKRMSVRAGVDTFSCSSLISEELASRLGCKIRPAGLGLTSLSGSPLNVAGKTWVKVRLESGKEVTADFIVLRNMEICPVLLGLDSHGAFGRYLVVNNDDKNARFVPAVGAVAQTRPDEDPGSTTGGKDVGSLRIENEDFSAWAEPVGDKYRWFFRWKFIKDPELVEGKQGPAMYEKAWFDEKVGKIWDDEVRKWIDEGILVEEKDEPDSPFPLLPWNLIDQPHKPSCPVRPTMDYTRLNKLIRLKTNESLNEVCLDEMRRWRCLGSDSGLLLDLSRAYLQVTLCPSQQRYQRVLFNGKVYQMTRLGFGLSIGPKVLCAILKCILRDFLEEGEIGVYRDDIAVLKGDSALAEKVRERVEAYGFHLKPAEPLDGAKLLGLFLRKDEAGVLHWERAEDLDPMLKGLDQLRTVREAAGFLGKIAAKYPVLGWLRVHAGVARSRVGKEAHAAGDDWDAPMSNELKHALLTIRDNLLAQGDPAKGRWHVDLQKGFDLYCDSSLQAEAAILYNDGTPVEDTTVCVRDPLHANVHELNAVLEGLKLFAKYYEVLKLSKSPKTTLKIWTDSSSVLSWTKILLSDGTLPKSKSMFWVLVERRLKAIRHIFEDMADMVDITIEHVPGKLNPADRLTRLLNGRGEVVAAVSLEQHNLLPNQLFERFCRALRNPPTVHADETVTAIAVAWHEELLHSSCRVAMETLNRWFNVEDPAGFRKRLEMVEEHCSTCAVKKARLRRFPSTGPVTVATRFNEEVFIDFLKIPEPAEGISGVVSIIDAYSRYATWTEVSGPVTSGAVTGALRCWRAEFGSPSVVRCDRGSENLNRFVGEFCVTNGIRVQYGSTGHPQSQSLVERLHRTLLLLLRTAKEADPSSTLAERLIEARRVYLRRSHSSLGMSPLERKQTVGLPPAPESAEEEFADYEEDDSLEIGLSAGDRALWKKVTPAKDEFGWVPGQIVKELGRGAYAFLADGKSRERIVNRDRLAPITAGEEEQPTVEETRPVRSRRPPNRYGFEE
jgi:transposase InsO family protein